MNIGNSNYGYHYFELVISIIRMSGINKSFRLFDIFRINDIHNSDYGYHLIELWISINNYGYPYIIMDITYWNYGYGYL